MLDVEEAFSLTFSPAQSVFPVIHYRSLAATENGGNSSLLNNGFIKGFMKYDIDYFIVIRLSDVRVIAHLIPRVHTRKVKAI